jgi:hypothetical protein
VASWLAFDHKPASYCYCKYINCPFYKPNGFICARRLNDIERKKTSFIIISKFNIDIKVFLAKIKKMGETEKYNSINFTF